MQLSLIQLIGMATLVVGLACFVRLLIKGVYRAACITTQSVEPTFAEIRQCAEESQLWARLIWERPLVVALACLAGSYAAHLGCSALSSAGYGGLALVAMLAVSTLTEALKEIKTAPARLASAARTAAASLRPLRMPASISLHRTQAPARSSAPARLEPSGEGLSID